MGLFESIPLVRGVDDGGVIGLSRGLQHGIPDPFPIIVFLNGGIRHVLVGGTRDDPRVLGILSPEHIIVIEGGHNRGVIVENRYLMIGLAI